MDDGAFWGDFESSDPYRDQTRNYVTACLGLHDEASIESHPATNPTIAAFETIGVALRNAYSHGNLANPLLSPSDGFPPPHAAPLTDSRPASPIHVSFRKLYQNESTRAENST